jgi:monoamine oxidase
MDIIVIGAGISGIYSACLLKSFGFNVKILEAKDRIGGRTLTIRENGKNIDLGGQWISSSQPRVMKLLKQLNVRYFDQYDEGTHIMNFTKLKTSNSNISDSEPNQKTMNLINKINQISSDIENYKHLDKITAKEWLDQNCDDEETKQIVDWLFKVCICLESTELSAYYWFNMINSCGGYEKIANIKNGAQEYRIMGGSMTLSEMLINKYQIPVLLNSPVTKIIDNKTICHVYSSGTIHNCNQVIVTIPPHLNRNIDYQPKLPEEKVKLYSNIKMGQVIKIIVLYDSP